MKIPKIVQPHTVTIQNYVSSGRHDVNFATGTDVQGYFQEGQEIVKDEDGNEVVGSGVFYTSESINPPVQSKLTKDSREYEIIEIYRHDNAMTGKRSHVKLVVK